MQLGLGYCAGTLNSHVGWVVTCCGLITYGRHHWQAEAGAGSNVEQGCGLIIDQASLFLPYFAAAIAGR